MTSAQKESAWETETGLVNDVDGFITNARFGKTDEYAEAVAAVSSGGGEMFLFDLMNAQGEIITARPQGYSIGSGWEIAEDGLSISHPKRKNVVGSSMYGQLQNKVVKDLAVDMDPRGKPTEVKSWDKLGFHWMQIEHATVGGDVRTSLMPTEFLGEFKGQAAPAATAAPPAPAKAASAPAAPATSSTLETKLGALATNLEVGAFQKAALAIPEVVANDSLMASVLDDSPTGFWATHQA